MRIRPRKNFSLEAGPLEYKTKRLDNATVQIILKNTPVEVQEAYNKAYERASKKVRIPGFRPGKVPLDVLERELGDAVQQEAAQILVSESMEKLISTIKPPPISVPSFEVEVFDKKNGATYKGTFDTYPEVKLGKYKKVKATQDVVDITEDDIQHEIERLRQNNAILHSREGAALAADLAMVEIEIKDRDSGKRLYQNKEYRMTLSEPTPFPGLVDHVVGMSAGESKSADQTIEESFPDEKFAGKNITTSVTVSQIQDAVLPEPTDDFAKEVSSFETFEALKADIRSALKKNAEMALKDKVVKKLLELISDDSKSELPQSLIEGEIKDRVRQLGRSLGKKDLEMDDLAKMMNKTSAELRIDLLEPSKSSVKKRLVLEEIAKKEEIKVTNDDIVKEAEERFGNIGDDLKKTLLENQKFIDELEGSVLFKKTFDWIYDHAEIKPGAKVTLASLRHEHDHDHDHEH